MDEGREGVDDADNFFAGMNVNMPQAGKSAGHSAIQTLPPSARSILEHFLKVSHGFKSFGTHTHHHQQDVSHTNRPQWRKWPSHTRR